MMLLIAIVRPEFISQRMVMHNVDLFYFYFFTDIRYPNIVQRQIIVTSRMMLSVSNKLVC